MGRGGWITAIGAGLCAGLLPGCVLFGHPAASDDHGGGRVATAAVKPHVEPPPKEDPLSIFIPSKSPYQPLDERPLVAGAGAVSTSARQAGPSVEHPTDEAEEHPPALPEVTVGPYEPQPAPKVVYPAAPSPPPEKKEPLLEALACFLKNDPAAALELLKGYQRSSQDVYIRLLPILAQLTRKGVDQLTPEEVSAIHEQLGSLAAELRPRARLVIDRMCFCERINGYGQYKGLPEGHTFRGRSGEQSGEQVLLYVELRNFALEPCPQGFVTRLSSSVEICDPAGKRQWYHDFRDQEPPLYRQAPWHDCFGNYRFYMPRIPPGDYTLTITIRDLTRPEAPRQDRRSLPVRVG